MVRSESESTAAAIAPIDLTVQREVQVDDAGFYDITFVCAYFGGSKPLHPATIYRGIADGRYPRPARPSPNVNRWIGRELKAAKQTILDAPREPLPSPKHRAKTA